MITEEALIASIAKESFYDFFKEFWGQIIHDPLTPNWHIKFICEELQKVAERIIAGKPKEYDLLINVPPGSTKSTICSQMFPAWVWTRMPHAQFICCSYAERIAFKDALRMRDIVQSDLYQKCFPNLKLRDDLNTKGMFKNVQMGYRLSAGLGGQVLGEHGHFLIVDDPLDPGQAASEAELARVTDFMQSTLPSRKINQKDSVIILIQQRLHQNDPSGVMIEKQKRGAPIKHICLPGALREGDETEVKPPHLKQYYKEGLLDPVRLPKSVLGQLEKDLGAYGAAGQIYQNPIPLGGGTFNTAKLQLVKEYPKGIKRLLRSWDKAGTQDGGCFSVGVLMGIDAHDDYWVLDIVRGQWGTTQREQTIRKTAELDGPDVEVILEIEGGSGGKESGENTVRNLAGFKVVLLHPTGDKESRAYGFASQVGAENVYVLIRNWTPDFIEELRYFPNSTYKDQVDAASQGFNRLAKRKRILGAF